MKDLIEAYGELKDAYKIASEEERIGLKIALDIITKKVTIQGKTVLIVGRHQGKSELFAELMHDSVELLLHEKMEMLKAEPLPLIEVSYPNMNAALSIKEDNKQFYKGIAK